MTRLTLVPLRDKIQILNNSYQNLEAYIKKRLFDFVIYDEDKAKKLKSEISERLEKQDRLNRVWAGLNIPMAYNEAASIAKEKLIKIKAEKKKKRFDLISTRTKKRGIRQIISKMDAANIKIKETVNQYFKLLKDANRKIPVLQNLVDNVEIIKGTDEIIKNSIIPSPRLTKVGTTYLATPTRGEVQKNIMDLFKKTFGDFDFITVNLKNGGTRNYKPDAYTKMLARTEMRAIQTQAIKDRCAEYNNDLVIVPPHDDPCEICEPFQGQIFSISGNHPTYPPLPDIPIHPNCEDTFDPTSEEAIKIDQQFGKVFPEPYWGSVQDRIDELRQIKKGEIISNAKTREQAIENMTKFISTLSQEEIAAIKEYTLNDYRHINTFLRGGQISLNASETENMNAIFNLLRKSPKYEGIVYRGAYFSKIEYQSFMANMQTGNITTLKGFTSTTLEKNLVEKFMLKFPEVTGSENVLFEIQSKNGVFLDGLSKIEKELEVLFTDKTKFEVLNISRIADEGKTIIKLREV